MYSAEITDVKVSGGTCVLKSRAGHSICLNSSISACAINGYVALISRGNGRNMVCTERFADVVLVTALDAMATGMNFTYRLLQ